MGRMLKNYLFWTYPRGSFHYDVMVTLILAFLFFSPLVVNYHERPQETHSSSKTVLVETAGAQSLVYEIGADQIGADQIGEEQVAIGSQIGSETVRAALLKKIEEISGDMQIDRYNAEKDASGRVMAYRVWAHRD